MAGKVIEVNDANFAQEVGQGVTLVDLWAPWCGPCRMVAPIVEQLAEEYEGKIKVAKLNVDDNPATAARYQVRSIPTLIFFKDGQPVETVVGAYPKQVLAQKFAAHAA